MLAGLLGDDGVIVSPTMCADAPPAAGPEPPGADVEVGLYDNTVAQNLTGFPAISLPAGVHASGVPFGLQVTAPPSREDLLLSVAETWERARPWPEAAPGLRAVRSVRRGSDQAVAPVPCPSQRRLTLGSGTSTSSGAVAAARAIDAP